MGLFHKKVDWLAAVRCGFQVNSRRCVREAAHEGVHLRWRRNGEAQELGEWYPITAASVVGPLTAGGYTDQLGNSSPVVTNMKEGE